MFKLSKLIEKHDTRPSNDKGSRVPQLLISNLPPTDDEEPLIRRGLAEAQNLEKKAESQLRSLDIPTPSTSKSQINQFKQAISHLQSAHEATLSHVSALSTYRRLPPELWILIFNFANDPYVLESWYRRPCVSSFRVSQVCRTWRNIALSTPELWTTLDLVVDGGTTKHFTSTPTETASGKSNIKSTAYCDFVAELLRRSQEKDLHVYVYPRYYECADLDKHPILRLLAPHLWRCSSLTVESTTLTIEAIFYSAGWRSSSFKVSTEMNGPTPQKRSSRLRALKLDFFDWNEATQRQMNLLPQEFPLLRHVELVGIRSESICSLPWAQLHTLKQSSGASWYWTPIIRTLIPVSPHLKTLKLAYQDYYSSLAPAVTSTAQLEAPNITALELHISPGYAPTLDILTHINFASLLELRVGAFPGDLLKDVIFIVTCLRPVSQLSLTKVAFRSEKMGSGLLERFLQLTPCLEELDIALPSPDDDNMKCLVSKKLVPRLAVLTIHAASATQIRAAQGALCFIGASRFASRQQDTTAPHTSVAENKFRITCSSPDDTYAALIALNMWHLKVTECQPFLRIVQWRLELAPLVDIISREEIPKSDRPQVVRRLHDLMLEIQSLRMNSGQDIVNLFRSKILDSLLTLCRAKNTHFVLYYARKYTFAEQVEKLLLRWKTDICNYFTESEADAPFMFESTRILAYHGSAAESLKKCSMTDLFEIKDDLFEVNWEKYMYGS